MSGLKMKYFVLKPGGKDEYAKASRKAMRAYAKHIGEFNKELADDLYKWASDEHVDAESEILEKIHIDDLKKTVAAQDERISDYWSKLLANEKRFNQIVNILEEASYKKQEYGRNIDEQDLGEIYKIAKGE